MEIKRVMGMNGFVKSGDLDKAVDFFQNVFGVEVDDEMPWLFQWGHRARVAYIGTETPILLELSESINDELPIGKQHKKLAPTFQILGCVVDNLDEAIAEMRAKGIKISDKLEINDPRFESIQECMISTKSTYGFIIELLEIKEKERGIGRISGKKPAKIEKGLGSKIKRVMGLNALCETGTRDKVIELFRDVLGAEIGPEMPHLAIWGHRARIAKLGTEVPFNVEISESINDDLPIGKQHARLAPTFQFPGFQVDNLDEVIADLRAKGIRVSDRQKIDDPEYEELYECMIHPRDSFGLLLEFIEDKGKDKK